MNDDINRPETEEGDGGRHMMGRVVQNFQFAARARGLNLGPISASEILEMADKGELKGMERSVEMVRGWVAVLDRKSSTQQQAQQENLDQVEYNKFLAGLTQEKIKQLVDKTVELTQPAPKET